MGIETQMVERMLEVTTTAIKSQLAKGESVFVRGFGSFDPKKRAAKTARNISAGTSVHIPEHYIPSFKPSPKFKDALSKLTGKVRHSRTKEAA